MDTRTGGRASTRPHQETYMETESRWSQDRYTTCFKFAARAHEGQKEPGSGLPYIVHITLVSMEIMAALSTDPHADGDLAVSCALLHDTLEDTRVVYDELLHRFGREIADGVLALTQNEQVGRNAPDKLEARNLRLADSLLRIKEQPREVWMVKMADRIVNLQPPPPAWATEKIRNYRRQAMQIHEQLHPANSFLASRLETKITAYEDFC